MTPPDEIRTARLVLRRPEMADAEALFAGYAQDAEVVRYLTWRPHREIAQTRQYLAACLEAWPGERHRTYIIDAPGRRVAGALDLRHGGSPHGVGFGYVLARPCWGQGYMSEALSAAVEWALAQPEAWRARTFCDAENRASARVMEKAGLRFEGVLRRWMILPNVDPDRPRDCLCYARVR